MACGGPGPGPVLWGLGSELLAAVRLLGWGMVMLVSGARNRGVIADCRTGGRVFSGSAAGEVKWFSSH